MVPLPGFRLAKLGFASLGMINSSEALDESYALFGNNISSGDDYLMALHNRVEAAMNNRVPLPVVRFADGEFAFYRASLQCNGLYIQAGSEQQVREAHSWHLPALRYTGEHGLLCPITYLYGLSWVTLDSVRDFLVFLARNEVEFTPNNYIPFYAVYAYLTSVAFMHLIDQKKVCIIGAELHSTAIERWTAQFHVHPQYQYVELPPTMVAINWPVFREEILAAIDPKSDLVLVAGGAAAGPICADVAHRFNVPALDAGHVVNLMNNQVQKSNGHRAYTFKGIYA